MLTQWQETVFGQSILNWEHSQLDQLTSNIFGYYALQLGLSQHDFLDKNRMPYKWHAQLIQAHKTSQLIDLPIDLILCPEYLPFASNSIDLLLLPHTLETVANPMQVLREVERVLVPEGRILLTCINPWRNFTAGLQKKKSNKPASDSDYVEHNERLSHQRIIDWLKLLGFEVELLMFGAHSPVIQSPSILKKMTFWEQAMSNLLPASGAVFIVMAVKRVPSIRLLSPNWQTKKRSSAVGAPARRNINKTKTLV
jgi:SAM-dependent methyltransferase